MLQVPVRHPASQADVLHMVLSHEARSQHEEFQAATHLCNVCLEHHLGSNGIRAQCGHWHCRPCLRELASVCMRDSNAAGVRCPRPSCRAALPPHIVQELMSQEELARWDELLLQKTLSSMRDVVFCPRCNLAAVESLDWAQCSGCHFAFCSLCYEAYHPGVICATPEQRLQVLALRVERSGNDSKVSCECRLCAAPVTGCTHPPLCIHVPAAVTRLFSGITKPQSNEIVHRRLLFSLLLLLPLECLSYPEWLSRGVVHTISLFVPCAQCVFETGRSFFWLSEFTEMQVHTFFAISGTQAPESTFISADVGGVAAGGGRSPAAEASTRG